MESANLHHHHHHQLQDHQLGVGSSPPPPPPPPPPPLATTPSCFAVGSTTHAWTTPNTTLNPSNLSSPNIGNGVILNARDISRQQNDFLAPSSSLNNSNSMIQDLGFHWATSGNNARIHDTYQNFTEMMINQSSSSSNTTQDFHLQQPTNISYMKNEERDLNGMMSEKLLLRNFSTGCQIKGLQFPAAGSSTRGSFSQIFPTINISELNRSSNSSINSSSRLDMNMQALDLFNSDNRFSQCLSPASSDNLGFYKDSLCYGLDHMQQSIHRPSNSPSKVSSAFTSGISSEAKRPSSFLEPKVPRQAAQKKSRSDSRASCPPIKVRKEKLGDRIAALQQLVAPFGKTDTASVLMEAIGYIKFLQNQVETLSVPYMKSSRNRSSRTIRGGSSEDGDEVPKRDLRSRGLCLVPLSCLSYVTDGGGGGGVWPPPNFS